MSTYTPLMSIPVLWLHKTKYFETQKMEGNPSLHIVRQSPVSSGMNANLKILFAWYENVPQKNHLLVRSLKNLRNRKQWNPSKHVEKKKQVNT